MTFRFHLLPALLLVPSFVLAADWVAALPGGGQLSIVEGKGYRLERQGADGRPDAGFGSGGTMPFTLGPDNDAPAMLRVDAQGRAWVAGATEAGGTLRPVVLRWTAAGQPDRSFGAGGRSQAVPAGREARATAVLPLDDGGAWVAGVVVDAQGDERSGLWRLRADGQLDSSVGLAGLWSDTGRNSEPADLARAPDGHFAIALRRAEGARTVLETWTWRDGGTPQRTSATALTGHEPDDHRLTWQAGGWRWGAGAAEAAEAPPPPAAEQAPAAAVSPFATGTAATPAAAPAEIDTTLGWWLLLPLAALAAWWWRRRAG